MSRRRTGDGPNRIIESRNRSAPERVAGHIRNMIVRGVLTHEDNLPTEAQLMDVFKVSRPTMREAMRILELDNLVEVARGPRGGAKVRRFTPELTARVIGQTLQASRTTLQDVFAARAVIEPPAARMAAETNPQVAALTLRKQIIAEYESLALPGMAHEASAFHIRLVEVSGNQTLALLGRALQQIIITHLYLIQDDAPHAPEAVRIEQRQALQAHEKLADLIADGDGPGAEAHWAQHLKRWIPRWLAHMGDGPLDLLEKTPDFQQKSSELTKAAAPPAARPKAVGD